MMSESLLVRHHFAQTERFLAIIAAAGLPASTACHAAAADGLNGGVVLWRDRLLAPRPCKRGHY